MCAVRPFGLSGPQRSGALDRFGHAACYHDAEAVVPLETRSTSPASATTTCDIIDSVPSIEDLLAAKITAVKALEEKQRSLKSATDDTDAVRQAIDTAWNAAAGGVALAHADDDPQFRVTLTRILDDRISVKRDQKLLAEWKVGTLRALDGEPAATAASEDGGNVRRQRKAALRRELESLSPAELLEQLEQTEKNQRQQEEDVASTRARLASTDADLRSRDRHWRVVVGLSVLTHADTVPNFRRELDQIFTQRIADKDRLLLDRWRNQDAPTIAPQPADQDAPTIAPQPADQDAPTIAPPPAETVLPGWVPRKLPDKKWGAAFLDPAGKDLPSDLVGVSIRVTPKTNGDPWITRIIEVVESTDDRILVRHEGRPSFPSPARKTPAMLPPEDRGDGAAGSSLP